MFDVAVQLLAACTFDDRDGDGMVDAELAFEVPTLPAPATLEGIHGKISADALSLRPRQFFIENDIQILTETGITTIDRSGHRLLLNSGDALDYDHLVLALGARNRPLGSPGAETSGVSGPTPMRSPDISTPAS